MSRWAATFTQADMARALRAAEQVAPGACWRLRISRQSEIIVEPAAEINRRKQRQREARDVRQPLEALAAAIIVGALAYALGEAPTPTTRAE